MDGLNDQRLGAEADDAQELLESQELRDSLRSLVAATKSVHEPVIDQSDTERVFAEDLENNVAIKLYAKLPAWFQVPMLLCSSQPGLGHAGGQARRRTARSLEEVLRFESAEE